MGSGGRMKLLLAFAVVAATLATAGPAGAQDGVGITVSSGNLTVLGTASHDVVFVRSAGAAGAYDIEIRAFPSLEIVSVQSVRNVTGRVRFLMGDGHDHVNARGVTFPDDVVFSGAGGTDFLHLKRVTIGDDLRVNLGSGSPVQQSDGFFGRHADRTKLEFVTIRDGFTFRGQAGQDDLYMSNTRVEEDIDVRMGDGWAKTQLRSVSAEQFSYSGRSGKDIVRVYDSGLGLDPEIATGTGSDLVEIKPGAVRTPEEISRTRTHWSGVASIDLGSGRDRLVLRHSDAADAVLGDGDDVATLAVAGRTSIDFGSGDDGVFVEVSGEPNRFDGGPGFDTSWGDHGELVNFEQACSTSPHVVPECSPIG